MRATIMLLATLAVTQAIPLSSSNKDGEKTNVDNSKKDSAVRQLQDLKDKLQTDQSSKSTSSESVEEQPSSVVMSKHEHVMTSHDGHKHVDAHERTTSNGAVVKDVAASLDQEGKPPHSHLKMHVDIPEENIHDTYINNDGDIAVKHHDYKRSRPNSLYTPKDFASYIYKTGDEESVSLIIQEMVEDYLMTTDEALRYLQEIKEALQYLNNEDSSKLDISDDYSSGFPFTKSSNKVAPPAMHYLESPTPDTEDSDYDGLWEKMKAYKDYESYAEFSIEDVIYQVAKVLFKHAYSRDGEAGSERTLEEVTQQLHKEVERGAIPAEIQKKVMDVIIGSLMDTVSESEGLMGPPGPVIGGSNFKLTNDDLRLLSRKEPKDNKKIPVEMYKKVLSANKDAAKMSLKKKDDKH